MPHVVMIIDDSPLERLITETIVKRNLPAYQIISFSSGVEALEHLQSLTTAEEKFPAVIFLDIHMPVMNGFDFLDEFLKFSEQVREPSKIVMFSSTENGEDRARMKKYPAIHKFLPKPLSGELIDEVRMLWSGDK